MKRKRVFALVLTVFLLALSFFPTTAMAASEWKRVSFVTAASTVRPVAASFDEGQAPTLSAVVTGIRSEYQSAVQSALENRAGVRVKISTVSNYLAGRTSHIQTPELLVLNVDKSADKKASMDLAQAVTAMISLDANFVGKKPSELEVVKVLGPSSFANYQAGNVQGDLVHGYFVVTSGDDSAIPRTTPILHATSNISIAFTISGDWDVGSGDRIIDPIFIVAPSGSTPTPVTSVTVTPAQKVMASGDTYTFTATVLPAGATQTVTWTSSNTAVATVNATTGLVTALTNTGTSTITATSQADATKTGTATATMGVPVTGVAVAPTSASVPAGQTTQLTATVTPTTATNQTVTWTSSNTSVATVNTTGLVTGVATGTAIITVTTTDGNRTATSTITVTGSVVPVTGVTVSPTTDTIGVGQTTQLTATVAPTTATNKNITWTSSNTSVATVSSTGVVTGVATGSATITATSQADSTKSGSATVTVASGPQPVTPLFPIPSGVEKADPVYVPNAVSDSGLNSSAGETVEPVSGTSSAVGAYATATHLTLKDSVISSILTYRGNSMYSNIKVKIPVFKATVSAAGRTGLVMFNLSTSSLTGYKAGLVVPVKAVSTSASAALTYSFVDAASKLADGKFGIVKSDKTTFMGADEVFQSGATYYIVFAVKDGGSFDMNSTNAIISDPTFVGVSTGQSSGGGGGCSTGMVAPAAILLALPVFGVFFGKRN